MTQPLRSNLDGRFRLAQTATIAGSLALGTLVVQRLFELFREDFFLYYGVSENRYDKLRASADAVLPMTIGQLTIVGIATCFVFAFVRGERRRLRQAADIAVTCRHASREAVSTRLSRQAQFDTFIARTSSFAGVLWMLWLLQTCAARWFGGFGWGLEYADWRSLLPLASVFGIAVFAGMVAALVSMVGLRAIEVLELVRAVLRRIRRIAKLALGHAYAMHEVRRTVRELIGCDILSRPPPVYA
ncbi:MAG: hypothetical protein JWM90_2851 [Thermoleophilia bacterium]|nr:hypothetical protein [Thermoleophilia bacterium]